MSTKHLLLFILLLLAVLLIRFLSYQEPSYKEGDKLVFDKTLTTQPQIKGTTQQFWMDGILVIAPRFPEHHYGDTIRISATLQRRVLNNNRTILTAYFPKIERIENNRNMFLAVTGLVRQNVINLFKSLPATEGSLMLGIVLGVKENMDQNFFDDLKKTGTLHVVAASGMNVAIVGGFLSSILTVIVRRQLALVLTMVGLVFYTALASFEPSIVRASIMGGLALSAQVLGRQNLPLFILALTAFFMLFFDPSLLFDIGFQLSFLATIGLIVLAPILNQSRAIKQIPFIKDSFTTTLAAQLFSLPILLANFGSFSLLSVAANTLILWTVPIIMVLGLVAAVLGFFIKPLAVLTLFLALPFLLFFETVVRLFGQLPGAFTISQFPAVLGIGYYLMLTAAVMFAGQLKNEG